MYADFALEETKGILAVHRKRRRLQARFFARLIVIENRFETLALCPSQIHAQQHVSPILRLGAARAGVDRHDGVARIVFPREQRLGFEFIEEIAQRGNLASQIGIDILALFGQVKIGVNVVTAAAKVGVSSKRMLQTLLLAHDLLRALRIGPQVRLGRLLFNFG